MIDTKHNKYIYTYELLKELEKIYDDELYLILGADNIIDFDKWKNYQELLKYKIIIMNRNDIDISKYIKKYKNNHFIIVRDFDYKVSSTDIRNNLNNEYLDESVLKYIAEHKMYQ